MLPVEPSGRAAATGAHFVPALGVLSCVERSDQLRGMLCALLSHEAFRACARKPLQACRWKILTWNLK